LHACFFPSKITGFATLFNRWADDVHDALGSVSEGPGTVDMVDMHKGTALDVIGSAAFAHEFNVVKGIDTPVTDAAASLLERARTTNIKTLVFVGSLAAFPLWILVVMGKYTKSAKALFDNVAKLDNWSKAAVKERNNWSEKSHDFDRSKPKKLSGQEALNKR
jgi:Cytochrome P450